MNARHAPRRPADWSPDPVLSHASGTPSFVRVAWDSRQARPFGPWRLAPIGDPLLEVEQPDGSVAGTTGVGDRGADPGATATAPARESIASPVDGRPEPRAIPVPREPAQQALTAAQRRQIEEAAHARGFAEGRAAALEERREAIEGEERLLRRTLAELQGLIDTPDRLHEPLRRLALRIAEALVRGELAASGDAVDRLVRGALERLEADGALPTVHLNPDDLAAADATVRSLSDQCRFEADPLLSRGSVRVAVRDALVEDLIEQRRDALTAQLLDPPVLR